MPGEAAGSDDSGGQPAWPLPPVPHKTDGTPRRIGVEFELQDIHVAELAIVAAEALGATVKRVSSAEYTVTSPKHGDYRVEIDSSLMKENAELRTQEAEVPALKDLANRVIDGIGSMVVPCEVVSPPIPVEELGGPMDDLIEAIRQAGGKGTRHSPLYAFGVHLNVEPPAMEPGVIVDYLRAFICLFDWIVDDGDVDTTRQLLPYIRRFPANYEALVTDPGYAPDWDRLIVDYLESNPTRNRALDMLPMLAHVDDAAVRAVVDDPLIKARPTFHFRLANCCVDDPDWSIAEPWARWLQIERLAGSESRLNGCCEAFNRNRERFLSKLDNPWKDEVQEWLTTS